MLQVAVGLIQQYRYNLQHALYSLHLLNVAVMYIHTLVCIDKQRPVESFNRTESCCYLRIYHLKMLPLCILDTDVS